MAASFDPQAMIERFRARAEAVRSRGLPPVEGAERQRFKEQARLDFMDFAMLGDATPSLEDGVLTLTVDLRPPAAERDGDADRGRGPGEHTGSAGPAGA